MTPDQLKNIKYGRSLLTGTISPQDIERRQQWIDRHLADVLDLAIKQQTRILEFQSAMESNAYEMEQAKIRHAEDIKLLNDRLTERREAYEEHIAKRKLLEPLVELVKEWGREKGITGPNGKGTLMAQAAKMMEEAQEAFDGAQILCSDGTKHEITDGIGDTMVTLILLAEMAGLTLTECLQCAYDEIKGRTGKMIDGTFVKTVTK